MYVTTDCYQRVKDRLKGKNIRDLFPEKCFRNFPYENVKKNHCLKCSNFMEDDELQPSYVYPAIGLCPECYQDLTSKDNSMCLVCGEELHMGYIYDQWSYPNELKFRIHNEGKCNYYFSLLAAHVFGEDTGVIGLNNNENKNI